MTYVLSTKIIYILKIQFILLKGGIFMKKRHLLLGAFSISSFLYWQNNGITVTKHRVSHNVPREFNGYKILQIADLQNKSFGKNHRVLINKIKKLQPNIIVITGDLLDRNRTNIDVVMDFINQAIKLSPIYFVTGNHEHQAPDNSLNIILQELQIVGVEVVDNSYSTIKRGSCKIEIIGLKDPYANKNYEKHLNALCKKDVFQILLSHRPELFPTYLQYPVDLVFTGHAHGGQVRLPYIGGLFSPHQGFFPPFSEGIHFKNDTTMIVSRGLGNSTFPFRINNRPELILTTLIYDDLA